MDFIKFNMLLGVLTDLITLLWLNFYYTRMGSIYMIYVNEKDLVVPGEILAEDDYYSGRGTFEDNGKICSNLLGLVSLRNKKINVIPLKSKYLPKKGDVVIGKIDDVRFSMWGVDLNSPYSGILPASEVFGREKKELSRVFDVGDVLFLRIVDVDEVKKVKLGLKGRGMGKFKGGIIVDIAPTKVPRLIGKKGSMINMIKDKTKCKIVVGQNGLVWVKGNKDMEQIVRNIIKLIEKEAHTSGLTDRIKNKLCLLIDGELPEDRKQKEQELFEESLKKPELQDFREEAEKELAEEGIIIEEDSDNDSNNDEDDSETSFGNDEEIVDEISEDIEEGSDESEDESKEELIEETADYDVDDESEDNAEDSEEAVEDVEVSDNELEDAISEVLSEEDSTSDKTDDVESDSESEDIIVDNDQSNNDETSDDVLEDEENNEDKNVKKHKFIDTFDFIKEQEKKNKSSFDVSQADDLGSPTLNISNNPKKNLKWRKSL